MQAAVENELVCDLVYTPFLKKTGCWLDWASGLGLSTPLDRILQGPSEVWMDACPHRKDSQPWALLVSFCLLIALPLHRHFLCYGLANPQSSVLESFPNEDRVVWENMRSGVERRCKSALRIICLASGHGLVEGHSGGSGVIIGLFLCSQLFWGAWDSG